MTPERFLIFLCEQHLMRAIFTFDEIGGYVLEWSNLGQIKMKIMTYRPILESDVAFAFELFGLKMEGVGAFLSCGDRGDAGA